MDQKLKKAPAVIFIIALCLYLPLIESCFPGTLWGVNWQSPIFMAHLSGKLLLLKCIMVILGLALLIIKNEAIKNTFNNVIVKNAFIVSGYVVAFIQIPIFLLGILFEGGWSSHIDDLHKEKHFNGRSIYVSTQNPGAIGAAYHYFYLTCRLPLNRYELKFITKVDWMSEYDVDIQGDNLVVIDHNKEDKPLVFNLTNLIVTVKRRFNSNLKNSN